MINSNEISVIVQGKTDNYTKECLKSVRKYLPKAEIILSTWYEDELSDIEGLYDILVLNKDPKAAKMDVDKKFDYNLNRQLLSSKTGIDKATKPYILRMRSDSCLSGNHFLKYWNKFPERNDKYSLFKHRVITSSLYTITAETGTNNEKGKNHPTPYHVSDWWHFGLKEDVKLLFSCPLVDMEEFARYIKEPHYNIEWLNHRMWRFPPEQYLGVELAKKKFPDLSFDNCLDYKNINMEQSIRFIVDNFITMDYKQSGIFVQKPEYKRMCEKFWKIPPHVFFTLFSFEAYKNFYKNIYFNKKFPKLSLRTFYYKFKNRRTL